MRRYHPIISEVRSYHDFGAKTNAANNKIKDFVNKAKSVQDAINRIEDYAKGSSGPAKKFADAIDSGKFTSWKASDDIKQEIESYFNAREREKKMGPRANDPDQNILVQIKGAADLRGKSKLKLDDGSIVWITQADAKFLVKVFFDPRVGIKKPAMKKKISDMLSKNKKGFTDTLALIKRSTSK